MTGRTVLFMVFLTVFLSPRGEARENSSTPIRIERAIEAAEQNDASLSEMESEMRILSTAIHPFLRRRLPVFSFEYGGIESYGLFSPYSLEHTITSSMEWNILSGGESLRERDSLRLKRETLHAHIAGRVGEIAGATVRSALGILSLRQELLQIDRMEDLLLLESRVAETLNERNRLTGMKRRELELEKQRIRLSRREKLLAIDEEESRFSRMIDPELKQSFTPEGRISYTPQGILDRGHTGSLGFFQTQAALHNPAVEKGARALRTLQLERQSSRRSYIPEVSLFTRLELTGRTWPLHLPSFTVGVKISSSHSLWSLHLQDEEYGSRIDYAREASALLRIDPQVLFQKEREQLEIKNRYAVAVHSQAKEKAVREATFLYRKLLLLEENHAIAVEESKLMKLRADLTRKNYDLGIASLKILLEAQTDFTNSRMKVYHLSVERCLQELALVIHTGLWNSLETVLSRYITTTDLPPRKELEK